jgi:toxin ParE1/3/4
MYKIEYLPVALADLKSIVDYISITLGNKKAALDFLDALDHSISRLQSFPYSCKIYQTQSFTNSEYRVLPVNNYLVFYVILADTVEIRRIIYARVNLDDMLRLPKQEF